MCSSDLRDSARAYRESKCVCESITARTDREKDRGIDRETKIDRKREEKIVVGVEVKRKRGRERERTTRRRRR